MKRRMALLLVALLMLANPAALAENYRIDPNNAAHFSALLSDLLAAYEAPSGNDAQRIEAELEAIRATSEADHVIARRIAEHWQNVYLRGDYPLCVHDGGERATALERTSLADSNAHAFVVLGYELRNGAMTEELAGRCEAAAAAARSYPHAILVCSGGATGSNNPKRRTEAGLMKAYLTENCGIDASRVFIDERAMTTVENAVNTLSILEANGIESMTLVTSTYHQKWAQAVYNAVAALYERSRGYSVRIVENYCFDIEPSSETFRNDARIAIRQLASVLGVV